MSVIDKASRWVVVRVSTPWIKFIAISAHAPHSGQSVPELKTWWDHLAATIPTQYHDWPRVLLADANSMQRLALTLVLKSGLMELKLVGRKPSPSRTLSVLKACGCSQPLIVMKDQLEPGSILQVDGFGRTSLAYQSIGIYGNVAHGSRKIVTPPFTMKIIVQLLSSCVGPRLQSLPWMCILMLLCFKSKYLAVFLHLDDVNNES